MSDEKTEEPSEQKLRQSREKGDVQQLKNVAEASTMLTGTLLVFSLWPIFISGVSDVFDLAFSDMNDSLASKWQDLSGALFDSFIFCIIVTAVLAFLGLFQHLLLNQFNFAPQSLTPKFDKLNPINGLKGIFSMTTLYNFFRLLVFFIASAWILYFVVNAYLSEIINASNCGVSCVADVFFHVFMLTIFLNLAVLLILAIIDFKIQKQIYLKKQKMSKEEVKREYKGQEGDPLIKSKRQQIAHEDAHAPLMSEITHVVFSGGFMVALVVKPGYLPYVAMKANGDQVGRLVARCRSMKAKCVNLPDIARDFYQKGAVGQYMKRDSIPGLKKIMQYS